MKNYQLYRTNVLLGGQMQLDLVTSSKNGASLKVDNAHISPISPMVPFTYSPQENILLYEHKDNIREFYKKIEGSFYQSFVNPELSHDWPIIYPVKDGDTVPKRYNDTYIYGCRRMPYDRYNEQFQILVPVWLEDVQKSLRLVINIWPMVEDDETHKLKSASAPLMTKTLEFRPDAEGDDFDAKFSRYLFDYFRHIKICKAEQEDLNDDVPEERPSGNQVINIDFDGTSSVHGLEVTSGNLTTKELPSIVSNILYRERPLMEVDNMIIESFKNNHMICKQLMNFSICFSVQDFITPTLTKELLGQPFRVSVDVYVDDKLLEKKDFFNNYEEIGLHIIRQNGLGLEVQSDDPAGSNALNYLNDYKCIDLMDKNKLSQNIIHWSVGGQNNYIFNVYGGFGHRMSNSSDKNKHCYDVYPDSLSANYDNDFRNFNWLEYMGLSEINELLDIYNNNDDPKQVKGYPRLAKRMTKFTNGDGSMIHGIKYNETYGDGFSNGGSTYDTLYVAFTYVDGDNRCVLGRELCSMSTADGKIVVWDVIGRRNPEEDTTGYLSQFKTSKMYLIIVQKRLDFNTLSTYLEDFVSQNSNDEYKFLSEWVRVLKSAVGPQTVQFTRGLASVYPDSPSKDTSEFQYVKKDINVNNYVIRYDGLISPTFIDVEGDNLWRNKVYYKSMLKTSEFSSSPFSVYGGSGYEPLYPSIGYFAIENRPLDETHYKNLDKKLVYDSINDEWVEQDEDSSLYVSDERPWFDNSQVLYVKKELALTVIVNTKDVEDIDALIDQSIIEELERIYGVHGNYVQSIYNLYERKVDWEYVSPTDIYTYNYYITLKLK